LAAAALAAFAASLSARAAGFSGALWVILEVSAAGRASFAGNLAALFFVHCRESAIRRAALVSTTIFFSHDYSTSIANGDVTDRRQALIGLRAENEPGPSRVARIPFNPCESLQNLRQAAGIGAGACALTNAQDSGAWVSPIRRLSEN
jgi:hypothetical protein